MEHRIFNPTDHIVSWNVEHEQNTYSYVFNPRELVLVREMFVSKLVNDNPDLVDETAIVNDPDYLDKEIEKYKQRILPKEEIEWIPQIKKGWFSRLFHKNCLMQYE